MILIYVFIAYCLIGTQSISTIDIEEKNADLLERRILSNRARNALAELQEDTNEDGHSESRREKLLTEVNKTPRIRSLKPFATQKIESSKRKRNRAHSVKTSDKVANPIAMAEFTKESEYEDKMSELRAEYIRLKKKVMDKLRKERKRKQPLRMAVERNNQELYQSMKVSIDPMMIALDDFEQFNDISDKKEADDSLTTDENGFKEIDNENIVGNILFQDELSTLETRPTTKLNTVTIDSTRLKMPTEIEDITRTDGEKSLEPTTTVITVKEEQASVTVGSQDMAPEKKTTDPVGDALLVRAVAAPVEPFLEVPESRAIVKEPESSTESSFQTDTPAVKGLSAADPTRNTVTLFQVDDEAQPKYFYDSRKTSELKNKKKIIVTEKIAATVTSATSESTTVTTTTTVGATTETDIKVVNLTDLDEDVGEVKAVETTTILTTEPTTTSPETTTTTTTVTENLHIQPIITTAEEITPTHHQPTVKVPKTTEIPEIIRKHLQTTTPLAFVTETNEATAINELELFSNNLMLINGAKELRNKQNLNTTDWTLEQVERELEEKKRALAELEKLHEYVSQKENQQRPAPRMVQPRKKHTVTQPKRARGSKLQQIKTHIEEVTTTTATTVSPDILELQNALNEIKFFEGPKTTTPSPINIVNWKEEMLSQNTIFPSLSAKKKYQSSSKSIEKEKKSHKRKRKYSGSSGSSEKTPKRGAHKKVMVESFSSLISMLEAENRSIRSAENEFCRRISCNFERGDFCEFESSFDEITRKKSKRTKRQADEPFYVLRSWSNWIGLPYESNLRIDKSPFFDSRNSRFAGIFLDPREVATLSLRATRGVRLRICCDEECPFSTEYGIHRGHKKWLQRTVTCPAKTKNIIIECVNSSDRFRGACGIDNLTLIKPMCSNEFKA